MSVTIELPPQEEQIAFNLKRWEELSHNETLAAINQRIETDRYGHVIMSPCASGWHGACGMEIGILLSRFLGGGRPIGECPISTSDGVKLADVGWFSDERFAEVRENLAFPKAPEICVEVLSPSNTVSEMDEKRKLHFEAGCVEFWTCDQNGMMKFYGSASGSSQDASQVCPDFPSKISI